DGERPTAARQGAIGQGLEVVQEEVRVVQTRAVLLSHEHDGVGIRWRDVVHALAAGRVVPEHEHRTEVAAEDVPSVVLAGLADSNSDRLPLHRQGDGVEALLNAGSGLDLVLVQASVLKRELLADDTGDAACAPLKLRSRGPEARARVR